MLTDATPWLPTNLQGLNGRFQTTHPSVLLRWAATTYGDDVVMATGFGQSGIVLMHMLAQLKLRLTIFYLQTDLFFPETLALRDQLSRQLGLTFAEIPASLTLSQQQKRYGPELWRHNPDLCCHLRKVVPLNHYLADKRGWITGIRRDQSPSRRSTQPLSWDHARQVVKIAPLASWSQAQVQRYIAQHNLPTNPLHAQGYASIGCQPCTRPVTADEPERAGRWAGKAKLECGIHLTPQYQSFTQI